MITKIGEIDTALTTSKSWPVVSIMSFMQGASPISMPVWIVFLEDGVQLVDLRVDLVAGDAGIPS